MKYLGIDSIKHSYLILISDLNRIKYSGINRMKYSSISKMEYSDQILIG